MGKCRQRDSLRGNRVGSMAVHLRGSEKAGVAGTERQGMTKTGGQRFKGPNQIGFVGHYRDVSFYSE